MKRKSQREAGQLSGRTTMPRLAVREAGSPLTNLIRGHPNISVVGFSLLVHQLEIPGEGLTRCTVILIIIPR